MAATQLPLAPAQRHRNQQLFADYYLDHVLPQRPDWQMLAADAQAALTQIATIWKQFTPSPIEAQTEDNLIKPVLAVLGHTFEVQAALATPVGTKKPDYVFYRDTAALNANKGKTLDEALLRAGAIAVGDAKAWDRSLDQTLKNAADQLTNRNPSYQISFYMQHSELTWGILTNGRLWRLYHKDTARRLDRFYEVNLPELIETNDAHAFLYFFAFFRRDAFDDGPLSLAELLRASAESARRVSDNLRSQMFDALRDVAQGFLDYPPNRLTTDAATLKQIYDQSLIVLYRLLFILYAEARDLLPARTSPSYRSEYSLQAITRDAARRLDMGTLVLPSSATVWSRLQALFQIIDLGNKPLQVATFNGGLFDPHKHPFLERHAVGDARLLQALDKLARVGGQFVDYRDLAERHLGTIYEGLLDYHIEAVAPSNGWTVDLFDAEGERHRTGSYYTPDFVVQYILDQTLGPVLHEAVAGKQNDADKIAAVLHVNLADPAMGSGHFLVGATEYIAHFLLDQGVLPDSDAAGEPDLAYWKRRVVQSCIYGVDLNPLAVELAKLSLWLSTVAKDRPLSFLDHHLRCGNAVVGSRLTLLQEQQPSTKKSTKKGNKQEQAQAASATQQLSMLDDDAFRQSISTAVDSLFLIEANPALTVADVKAQEAAFTQVRAELTHRYTQAADLETAATWGLPLDAAVRRAVLDYAAGRTAALFPQAAAARDEAAALAATQRFFHWDLEFPEVFFNQHGQPLGERAGFDVVVGNPPYVRQEQLAPLKAYFQQAYGETYSGTADLYVYVLHQGLRLLRQGGRLSYISSNSWLRANYATPLRAFLRTQVTVEQIVDLGDNRVFPDVPDVYPAILVARKDAPPADYTAAAAVFNRNEGVKNLPQQVAAKRAPVSIHDQSDSGWQLGDAEGRRLVSKLLATGKSLGQVVEGHIYIGIKTGLNEAFIIDQATRDRLVADDPSCDALLFPMRRGEDLRSWYQEDEGRWLIGLPYRWTRRQFGNGLDEATAWQRLQQQHPSIAAHLAPFADTARKRGDKGEFWWELRPCDYYDAFDQPKIFWPDIAKAPRFVWDEAHTRIGNTGYFTPAVSPYLLGVLSCRATWFVLSRLSQSFGERAGVERFRLFTQSMERVPIPDAPAAEREAIGALAMQITGEAKARYELHRRARRRIVQDLGTPGVALNQKLHAWWTLDFPAFHTEIQKVFKRDIPVKDRDDWDEWLHARRAEHTQRTDAIIAAETALNARVYALFDLSTDEIALVEASTKYRYGEV